MKSKYVIINDYTWLLIYTIIHWMWYLFRDHRWEKETVTQTDLSQQGIPKPVAIIFWCVR